MATSSLLSIFATAILPIVAITTVGYVLGICLAVRQIVNGFRNRLPVATVSVRKNGAGGRNTRLVGRRAGNSASPTSKPKSTPSESNSPTEIATFWNSKSRSENSKLASDATTTRTLHPAGAVEPRLRPILIPKPPARRRPTTIPTLTTMLLPDVNQVTKERHDPFLTRTGQIGRASCRERV